MPVPASAKIPSSAPPDAFALAPKTDRRFRDPARLRWIGDSLHLDGKGKPVVRIVTDAKYPGVMWRVRLPSGELSGMLNRTRCKDAALAFACRVLGEA